MRFLSLFSGIGGFDLGLERAGMECAGQVEIDPYCLAVLKKHWPKVRRKENIYDVKKGDFEKIDLICGGFPCQPFPSAGKRKGKEDVRYLWPEMLRVIEEFRPRWIIGENVAGIISIVALDQVLSDLERKDYTSRAFVIPACGVDAPHRRDRVWIVAHAKSERARGTVGNIFAAEPGSGGTLFQQADGTGESQPGANVAHAEGARLERDKPAGNSRAGGRAAERGEVMADSECQRRSGGTTEQGADRREKPARDSDVADADGSLRDGRTGQSKRETQGRDATGRRGKVMADAGRGGGEGEGGGVGGSTEPAWWIPEPDVGRVAYGISNRVDRLKCLGNSVVPQVVEEIGRAIMLIENQTKPNPKPKGRS